MRNRLPRLIDFRGLLAAAWLVLLAGCVPEPSAVGPGPANLAATAGDAVVTLGWSPVTGATSYSVKRSAASGGPYLQLASISSAGYTDSSAANGTTYYYVVSALTSAGESANSTQASATPAAATTAPLAPANLTAVAGRTQVTLTWSISTGASSYRVKRSTVSNGPYAQISAPTIATYIDTAVTLGTTYYYVVSAVNSATESPNSTQVSATPSNPPPTTFGTWTNVTPTGVDLTSTLCSNFGATNVQAVIASPSNLYVQFHCQGIWKSTDYGLTWTGPVNTGTNGATAGNCSGGISIPRGATAASTVIYQACIRGSATGFWRSLDSGVNWTRYAVAPGGARQDYYPPAVDPYDDNHLLMAAHEFDSLVQSVDGGQNWTSVPLAPGMLQTARSASVFYVNTGSATTTRNTWLWVGEQSGGAVGTWRTTNGGATWVQVEKNEQIGSEQIYQPDNSGVVYMAGVYSALGWGVLRSSDYGQTWVHVGSAAAKSVVFGTTANVYAMYGFPVGPGGTANPGFAVAAQPGTGTWVEPGTPAALLQGPAQVAVVNDGSRNIFLGAMWNSGLWRYIEP